MSTELANAFAEDHHEKYAEVLDAWANTAAGHEVTDKMVVKWGADLHEALADDLIEALMAKDALALWSGKGITLPSKETLVRYSQIAAKYALQYATRDLLDRLVKSATFNKNNPSEVVTASSNATFVWTANQYTNTSSNSTGLIAAIRPMRPAELSKRSPQTVAQIFDMAKDRFSRTLSGFLTRNQQFTGRRKWITTSKNSRHASLNGEIADFNEKFTFNKENVVGPRPVGGSPAHWSNCSCRLQYETKKGKWIDG